MNALSHKRFEIHEAIDAAARDEVYRFRYRIYVEAMGLRLKHADHRLKRVVDPLDETARVYAAWSDGRIVGTIRGNRLSDPATAYYHRLNRIDGRFPFAPEEMSLTTKLMFDPALQRTVYPIRLILHYARGFNAERLCKIDFVHCQRWLLPFFLKLGYVDYVGWVLHNEVGCMRPLFCPADQVARLERLGSPLAAVAREFCRNNMFGGEDLIRRLALPDGRAARLERRPGASRRAGAGSSPLVRGIAAE